MPQTFWLCRDISNLEYIQLLESKAFVLRSNLKQSPKGVGGRDLRKSRLKLRTFEARTKKHHSYKKKECTADLELSDKTFTYIKALF